LKSGVFDLVSANIVVEHIANPELVGKNLNRILKPGRLLISTLPTSGNIRRGWFHGCLRD
jgi:2-polyprenyl-3-methyl-5-hydroxy-6-metoxy-1,4-benzoquinol methylase